MDRPRIVIIGSGNVASHLAPALSLANDVVQVYSRNTDHARELADRIDGCQPVSSPDDIIDDADLYIISVNDDSIADVSLLFEKCTGVVVHTSGSVGMEALCNAGKAQGVLYPLQTFTKGVGVDMGEVPFFNEASSPAALEFIDTVASSISPHVYHADSRQRACLHIAAVFACNFTNLMWTISDETLQSAGYDISVFKPLLEATLAKAFSNGPANSQTGPAKRCDIELMRKHLTRLEAREKEIYRLLSNTILEKYNPEINEQNRL